ncbi:MAG TPA: trypsin-like peptidase domain-containing protein [Anaerobutyricum hallii]|uniref:S1C family serine protease n=1 Tax=Anaerobutyricum hallii TaxID=39488 RepID=UPI00242DC5CE|nr:trypsin-like peptidase domain-containing protein [Anaerobutyricum hallii]HJH98867.1 trypsin-like peptidase domain-containing protein [Anaerobutyricum hallii]
MNEFENGFHNENLENNRINNQENNSQQVAIDVTPIEESVTQENTESHRYSYREQGTGGSSYQYDNGNNSNDTYNNSYSSHGWRDESTYNNENYYGNIPPEPDKRRRQRKNGSKNNKNGMGKKAAKLVASAAVFGLVAGACFVGVSVAKDKLYPSTADRIETTSGTTSAKSETSSSGSSSSSSNVASVVNEVMPSVVSITSTIQSSNYYGFGTQESEGAGSGFIVAKTKDNLMIATNNHVVSDATSLTVGFADDTTAKATVVGTDSSADLAVISVKIKDIKDSTASKIKVATLGSSDDLKVGEEVVAIGNALGYGQSVTTGVVSAKNREVSLTDGTMNLLQTDAAINPGNSGGVLINMDGQVVGINNAKLEDTSVEGMGYAIPITTAKTILTDLMNASSVSTKDAAFLGVVGRDINESYSSALGIPSGIYVSQVVSGSPAEKAGISAGDVITKFEGNNVSTMSGLKEKLALKKANTKVKITFKRANQSGTYEEKTVTVTLGKKSDFSDVTTDNSSDSSNDSNNNFNNGNNNGNSNGNSGNSNGNSGDYGYGNGNFGNDNGNGYINPYEYFFGNNY